MEKHVLSILRWLWELVQTNTATGLAALFGTFFGAYFAFLFERRHAEKKERASQISAFKKAQFAIAAQLNACKNIKHQVLYPHKDDPDRHLTLKPFSVLAAYPKLDIGSLAFMLDGEAAQLVNELMISEHKFQTLVRALVQRGERHEVMQRRIATDGPEIALDQATITILKDMTDSLYGLADDAVTGLNDASENLKREAVKRFPKTPTLSVAWK